MDLFSELIDAVQSDLTIGDETPLLDLATVKLAINRGKRKIEGLFRWPETEDAKTTTIQEASEYIDYPQSWRPNSIWKLKVGTVDYGDPLVFRDYLYEKENEFPAGLDEMWANNWRRYFVYPTLAAGNVVEVHGQKIQPALSADGDVTIFSYSMPEVNEAIVLEAVAILKSKGEERRNGEMLSAEAKQIAIIAAGKISKELAKYEKTMPLLEVPDFFQKRGQKQDTGKFNV